MLGDDLDDEVRIWLIHACLQRVGRKQEPLELRVRRRRM
jgi:hypothetical protein